MRTNLPPTTPVEDANHFQWKDKTKGSIELERRRKSKKREGKTRWWIQSWKWGIWRRWRKGSEVNCGRWNIKISWQIYSFWSMKQKNYHKNMDISTLLVPISFICPILKSNSLFGFIPTCSPKTAFIPSKNPTNNSPKNSSTAPSKWPSRKCSLLSPFPMSPRTMNS